MVHLGMKELDTQKMTLAEADLHTYYRSYNFNGVGYGLVGSTALGEAIKTRAHNMSLDKWRKSVIDFEPAKKLLNNETPEALTRIWKSLFKGLDLPEQGFFESGVTAEQLLALYEHCTDLDCRLTLKDALTFLKEQW